MEATKWLGQLDKRNYPECKNRHGDQTLINPAPNYCTRIPAACIDSNKLYFCTTSSPDAWAKPESFCLIPSYDICNINCNFSAVSDDRGISASLFLCCFNICASVLGASAALDGAHFPEPDNVSLGLPSPPTMEQPALSSVVSSAYNAVYMTLDWK